MTLFYASTVLCNIYLLSVLGEQSFESCQLLHTGKTTAKLPQGEMEFGVLKLLRKK